MNTWTYIYYIKMYILYGVTNQMTFYLSQGDCMIGTFHKLFSDYFQAFFQTTKRKAMCLSLSISVHLFAFWQIYFIHCFDRGKQDTILIATMYSSVHTLFLKLNKYWLYTKWPSFGFWPLKMGNIHWDFIETTLSLGLNNVGPWKWRFQNESLIRTRIKIILRYL